MNTELIDTDRISVKFNFRTSFDEAKIKELSQSILKCGVLQPIILRKAGKELVLVAGERRVRAAKLAGLKQIPCRILDLTEEQALEAACIENLHREDLNPMEEARAFKTLMARGAWQVEDIALKVDKSRSYVYRAIRLLDLPEKAQNALADGKISSAHALQLLRLDEKNIETMLDKVLEGDVSARELSREIEWCFGKRLEDVCFPLDKEYAGRGPCRTCMFNSENQQNLFDEALEAGRCMKEDCFKAKKEFFNKELEKEARKEAKAEGYVFEKDKYGYGMKFFFNEYPVLTEEERKKLAREIKKNPSEFGIGADKAFSVIRMFAVGKAAQEKLKELRESAQAAEEAPQEEDEDWQKENFIREGTERLILKGLPKLKCEIPKDFDDAFSLFDGLSHNQEKWLLKKFGVKSFRAEDLKALPPEKILMIFYLDKKILWQDSFPDVICDLAGLDAKKLREDCEAQAKQAWDNRE